MKYLQYKSIVLILTMPVLCFYQAALFCASSSASGKKLGASSKQKTADKAKAAAQMAADKEKAAAQKKAEEAFERLYKTANAVITEKNTDEKRKKDLLGQAEADHLLLEKAPFKYHQDSSDLYDIVNGTITAPFIQQIVLKRVIGNHPFLNKSATSSTTTTPSNTSSSGSAAAANCH